jgi:hypothetical protein
MSVPAGLSTLSAAAVGDVVEVRALLFGAGEVAASLCTGDRIACRARTEDWIVLARPGFGEVAISRRDAGFVQVERCLTVPDSARRG